MRIRRPSSSSKSIIKELEVPRRPDCVGLGEATKITVYIKGCIQRNWTKKPIYLRVDCVDWLLSYAADEHFNHCVKSAAVDEVVANFAAVADLNLEWDSKEKVWQAEFVSGPLKGTTRRFGVSDLTTDRLNKMEVAGIGQTYTKGGMGVRLRRKKQAKDFILLWCDAISRGNHTFEVDWSLQETTPVKKRKTLK